MSRTCCAHWRRGSSARSRASIATSTPPKTPCRRRCSRRRPSGRRRACRTTPMPGWSPPPPGASSTCGAPTPPGAGTDWPQILALYGVLERIAPGPIVTLNRAVALAMVDGPRAGLALLATVEEQAVRPLPVGGRARASAGDGRRPRGCSHPASGRRRRHAKSGRAGLSPHRDRAPGLGQIGTLTRVGLRSRVGQSPVARATPTAAARSTAARTNA